MSTDERLPAEERGGSTDKPEREYVISNRPDDSDAMPGPDDAEEDDAEDEDEEDANDVKHPAAEPGKPGQTQRN
jgi:hypothetical protein